MREFEIVISATSKQTKLVEEAQTEILKIAKKAAEQMQSQDLFMREVNKILVALEKQLDSEEIKTKCRAVLPYFALRTLIRERKLIETYAAWYVFALLANRKGLRGSKKVLQVAKQNISSTLRGTPAFKVLSINIPDEAYNWALPLERYQKNYMRTVHDLTAQLVSGDAKEDYSSTVNLRNIAEMTVRYEEQMDMIQKLRENDVKLVWIEPHANCSKRCEKYQVGGSMHPSGLYSLDGTTGYIDGIFYRPLEFATNNAKDLYVTKAGKVYQNGCITGFNCRHRLVPYKRGNKPNVIPSDVIERRRKIEETQRLYERAIREKRREAIVFNGVDPERSKKARQNVKQLVKRYEEYSLKNKAPFFRERESIFLDADNL